MRSGESVSISIPDIPFSSFLGSDYSSSLENESTTSSSTLGLSAGPVGEIHYAFDTTKVIPIINIFDLLIDVLL